MNHDWEEFIAVGLLEIMLSRVNAIVIELSNIFKEPCGIKCDILSDIESEQLEKVNELFYELKEVFYSDSHLRNSESDEGKLREVLAKIVTELQTTILLQKEHPSSFLFFTSEQYEILKDFFQIASAWMQITKTGPEDVSGKMDIIYVIYKYLCNTTAQRTSPALINALVESCQDELDRLNQNDEKREFVINKCNCSLKEREQAISKRFCGRAFISEYKKELKNSFIVKFNEPYAENIRYVLEFIHKQLVNSTRVQFMTKKAHTIVYKLLNFYYENPYMLPLKYRKRIDLETNVSEIASRTTELLKEYYEDKICEAIQDDASEGNGHKHFDRIKTQISQKMSTVVEQKFDTFSSDNYKKMIEAVTNILDSSKHFAKDAILIRIIADYVSSMTDRMAEKKYNEICSSSTQWSKAYSERGTIDI